MRRLLTYCFMAAFLASGGPAWADAKSHGPRPVATAGAHRNQKHPARIGRREIKIEKRAVKTGVRAPMRFRGLDRDHNGRITRAEWRGNDVSFRVHDWNGDGVLSGNEVRPGAHKPSTR